MPRNASRRTRRTRKSRKTRGGFAFLSKKFNFNNYRRGSIGGKRRKTRRMRRMRGGFDSGSTANSISDAASGASYRLDASLARNDFGNKYSDQANSIIKTQTTPYDMYLKTLKTTADNYTLANTQQLQSYINRSIAQPNIKTDINLQNKIMTKMGDAEGKFINSLK